MENLNEEIINPVETTEDSISPEVITSELALPNMQPTQYSIYVEVDDRKRVIALYSNLFHKVEEGKSILVDQGFGDRFAHAEGNYLALANMKPLMTSMNIPNYKLTEKTTTQNETEVALHVIVERTDEEIQEDVTNIPAPPRSAIELINDQVGQNTKEIGVTRDMTLSNMTASTEIYEKTVESSKMVMVSLEALTELDNRITELEQKQKITD